MPSLTAISIDDYRQRERDGNQRHEYRDGTIEPMTGGTSAHNAIAVSITALLKIGLKGQNYKVRAGDMRLWIPKFREATYPDVMVVAGEIVFSGDRQDEILNPCLIIEILSKSTADRDRGEKFRIYRSIPEFCEYLLVDQYEPRVEQFVRVSPKEWTLALYDRLDEKVQLKSIPLTMAVADIYEEFAWSE